MSPNNHKQASGLITATPDMRAALDAEVTCVKAENTDCANMMAGHSALFPAPQALATNAATEPPANGSLTR